MLTMGYEASFFSSQPFTVRRLSAFSLTYQGMLRDTSEGGASKLLYGGIYKFQKRLFGQTFILRMRTPVRIYCFI